MKKYLLFTTLSFGVIVSHAQIRFGAKAGLNLSSIMEPSPGFNASNNSKPGLNAGALLQWPLSGKFALQPEIVYAGIGSNVKTSFNNITYALHYITIPVLLTYHPSPKFFIEMGPQAGFLLRARKKVHASSLVFEDPNDPLIDHPGDNKDVKQKFNSFDFSGVVGAGYHFSKNIGAAVSYHLSLLNIAKANTSSATRNSVFQLDIFYLFNR